MITEKFNWNRFTRAVTLAFIAMAAFVGASATAQTTTASVRGYVTETGGAVVSDAQVVATLKSTNQVRRATTNSAGFYFLGGLTPGLYEISVRRLGLQPQTRSLQLSIGQTVDLNLSTSEAVAQLSSVEVRSNATGTDSRTSEVGTNISRTQINDLPTFERNILDLAKLAPGISAQAVNNTDKFLAAGGQPAEAVNVFVDGATYKNDVLRGGVVGQDASKGNPFPQGAIQEFRVLTQNYKAEYQKAASAIIVATTRSGSNATEANLFANGVARSFVARDEIAVRNNGAKPKYKRLQAGGDIGGPIIKDKLFYFGTYELNFRDEPADVRLGGDSLRAPASLVNELRNSTGQFAQQFREHLGLAKLTWNASELNTLDASITVRKDTDFRGFGGQTSFESAENLAINTYTGVLNFKHAGATWLNQAQVNAQYFQWNPTGTNIGVVGKNYFGLLRVGGKDTEQNWKQSRLSLRDDVTRAGVRFAGDHVFKGGASVDFLSYSATKFFNGNPFFNFRSDENWQRPFESFIGFGDPTIKKNNVQFGAFLQDDWTVGRKLVLNLGIRWDAETNMINNDYVTPAPLADSLRAAYTAGKLIVDQPLPNNQSRNNNVISQLGGIERYLTTGRETRPIYKKAFQPRVGASYDFFGTGKTVIFGGGGLYFDRNYWNTLLDEQFRRQYSVIRIDFRNSCAGLTNCAIWDPKFFDPAALRALSVVAGAPEVFLVANDLVPPRTIQMSAGLRQTLGAELLTLSYNGLRGRNFMNFVRGSPFGGGGLPYNTVFVTDDRVKTWYDAMQLQIERPFVGGSRWGGSLAYTLSRSEEQGQSQDIFWGFDGRYPTVADRPRLRAPGDQRHAVVANAIVQLPFDVRFSTIVNLGSGIAVNATDASLGFETGKQRTYVFQPPERAFLGVGKVFAFQNMDIRVDKDLRFASQQTASVIVDVFNVFNSDNLGCFETTIQPGGPAANANYGKPNCAGLGRRLQLGVRYGFRPLGQAR
ncbi:MAG: carboxypeptidase regulatory-like domain-containing protein [Gemmatimonadales bacterium]